MFHSLTLVMMTCSPAVLSKLQATVARQVICSSIITGVTSHHACYYILNIETSKEDEDAEESFEYPGIVMHSVYCKEAHFNVVLF